MSFFTKYWFWHQDIKCSKVKYSWLFWCTAASSSIHCLVTKFYHLVSNITLRSNHLVIWLTKRILFPVFIYGLTHALVEIILAFVLVPRTRDLLFSLCHIYHSYKFWANVLTREYMTSLWAVPLHDLPVYWSLCLLFASYLCITLVRVLAQPRRFLLLPLPLVSAVLITSNISLGCIGRFGNNFTCSYLLNILLFSYYSRMYFRMCISVCKK